MKQRPWLLALIPIVLAIVVIAGVRQVFSRPSLATLTRRANGELRRGNVESAVRILADVAARDPSNGAAWFRLGHAHHTAKAYPQAIEAYGKAYALNWIPGTTAYNLACAYALEGDHDAAIRWLETALRQGFRDSRLLETDPDLDPVRGEEAYRKLMARYERDASASGVGALKPFFGSWEALDEKGDGVGSVEFTPMLRGFAVQQVTQLARRSAQVAMFYYNGQANLWKQVEAAEDGSFVERVAKPQLDGLRFEGWSYPASGGNAMDRVVWTERDGGYRYVHEVSNDSGRTWTVLMDLQLRKRPSPR